VFIAVLIAAVLTIAGGLAMPRAHVDDVEHRPVDEAADTADTANAVGSAESARPGKSNEP
jgi:hypothetical protein